MNEKAKKRFWDEFYIPTQKDSKEVAFANPADVARFLISSRNWYGSITQWLVDLKRDKEKIDFEASTTTKQKSALERSILARIIIKGELSATAVKNKEVQSGSVFAYAGDDEREVLDQLEDQIATLYGQADLNTVDIEEAEAMRRAIERTTDWLVQYINWQKFELRDLS